MARDILVSGPNQLAKFRNGPFSRSKFISDRLKISIGKWGPFSVIVAIQLHAVGDSAAALFPVKSSEKTLNV